MYESSSNSPSVQVLHQQVSGGVKANADNAEHDRMKEEVMMVGIMMCCMSPECLTYTRGAEVRPRINVSWVSRRGKITAVLYTEENDGSRARNSQNSWLEQNIAENEEGEEAL